MLPSLMLFSVTHVNGILREFLALSHFAWLYIFLCTYCQNRTVLAPNSRLKKIGQQLKRSIGLIVVPCMLHAACCMLQSHISCMLQSHVFFMLQSHISCMLQSHMSFMLQSHISYAGRIISNCQWLKWISWEKPCHSL